MIQELDTTLEMTWAPLCVPIRPDIVRFPSPARHAPSHTRSYANGLEVTAMRRYFFILAFLLVGCSSGDVDEFVAPDAADPPPTALPPPTILPTYNFEIGGVQEGTDTTVYVGGQLQVEIDLGDTLRGSVEFTPRNSYLQTFVTDAGSTMTVTVAGTNTDLDGTFTLNLTSDVSGAKEALTMMGGAYYGAFEVVTPTETVTVNMITSDLFPYGVEMSLNGATATFFEWHEYYSLLHDLKAETWQRRASVAAAAFGYVIDRMFEIVGLLDSLEQTESADPIVSACDEFQGTPPAGVLLQGEDLSPGDVFDWTFTNCWFADSNSLFDNSMQMQNYIEVFDSSNTLTRIGFGPNDNVSGGVIYFGWRVAETLENQGVYTIDPASQIEVNGGFSVLFTQP